MEKMAQYDAMKEWWKLTDPLQEPVEEAKPGEWWSIMDEVFYTN